MPNLGGELARASDAQARLQTSANLTDREGHIDRKIPPRGKPSSPRRGNGGARARRLEAKRQRSALKRSRARPDLEG